MKLVLFSIIFVVSSCGANHFVCQLFNFKRKSLEKYCENFTGKIPENCEREIGTLLSNQVEQLKVGGCEIVTVLDSIETFKNVRVLDISYSSYKTLDWLDLNVESLEILNASHNELSNIQIFQQNASKLTEIDLSHNQLRRIPPDSFRGADQLAMIHLSHNDINSINAATFANSTNLEYIDLSDNRFWSVPVFPHNKKLKELHLENNPILTFSCSELSSMSSTSLYFPWSSAISFHGDGDCEQKPMHVVRDYIYDGVLVTKEKTHEIHCCEQSFRNLTIFIAGHNSFANVGDLLQCFGQSIMHVDLSANFIGMLNTAVLERFDGLTALSLSKTMLIDFDFNMLKSKHLMKLDMSKNYLTHLRNVQLLEDLDSLEEFYIGGNHIENIPEIVQHLKPSILTLDLSGNFVGVLNTTTFEHLTALRSLNLSNTLLLICDFSPFQMLTNLSTLDISRNSLTGVNFTMLSNLNNLIRLKAAHCQIENISHVIQHLRPSIKELDVSGNLFGTLEATFDHLIHLEALNLSNSNIVNFDLSSLQHQKNLKLLDISFNKLQELNFARSTSRFTHLNLEGNDLAKINNLNQTRFIQLGALAISKNQLPCSYLKQLRSEWNELKFIGDPFDQKHGKNCHSRIQVISDFFNSTYNNVKFW